MSVGVTGADGRMGRVVREVLDSRGVEVAFAAARNPGAAGALDDEAEFAALLDLREPDAVVDFTAPEATVRYAGACADAGVPLVTGTTGFDEGERAALRAAGDSTPVLVGANFSRGIQALLSAVEAAAGALPEYDVEVTETHHNGKVDAPSGTAGLLLDRIEDARGEGERVHGREGDQPRREGEVGVHARRAGDVTGEHEVLIAGNSEVLELTHRAGDRRVFAEGAVDAAAWLAAQPAGYYEFSEVAADV
ncbi:4-hydroxy-tetrahydrodipicolinate reductase [Halobacterium jilantaiense]|uniref:4-hydroxy-tetrahydrodipicolinate reductase n=1 Tax=Halobacterium jilantaiense TaxID=355548 RepID=A0A1I0NUT7_9EURY|nr:4-hydroxy-tetrahydrodipicolinate reductase [Halobacterium jilantaiense]SEW04711.1 dihydrodipicolinate reductase [Halobacterium jilantaiense]